MRPRRSAQRLARAVAALAITAGAVAGISSAGAPAAAIPSAAAAPCVAWTGGEQPSDPGGTSQNNTLWGVAVLSPCNAWAVGDYDPGQTQIAHWDGASWTQVPSPDPGPQARLFGVHALSVSNVWAVGDYFDGSIYKTLIVHWDGSAWTQVPSPNVSGATQNVLKAVRGSSATNVWAVGYFHNGNNVDQTLILHWNGTAWTQVPSPNPDPSGFPALSAVTATSGTDAWAVGTRCISGCGTGANVFQALLLHWNGNTWSQVPSPSTNVPFLFGAAAASRTSAWAVGTDIHFKSVILHWNGTKWSTVPSPNPVPVATLLRGAAATSPSDAWAVGYGGPLGGAGSTVILHWNGTAWSAVKSPNP